ncbi:MAG: hypothetical protein AAFX09_00030 [Pseudomonadota bacterium]
MLVFAPLAAALTFATPAIDGPAAERSYLLRAEASAADRACDLFTLSEKRVLAAGLRQSSADLLAAGASLRAIEAADRRIDSDPSLQNCDGEQVQAIATRVRQAHQIYMSQIVWELPGRVRSWIANRGHSLEGMWPIRQDLDAATAIGWAKREDGGALLLATRVDGRPASAVIIMRDRTRAEPSDATAGGLLPPPGGEPLAAFGPPPWAEKRIFASERLDRREARIFAPAGERQALAFSFPASALETLVDLDPREGVRIELLNGEGGAVESWWMEVGALRAAVDFIAAFDAQMAAPIESD